MIKNLIKNSFRSVGFEIKSRDLLAEQIPSGYSASPFLPTIRKGMLHKLFYYEDVFRRTATLEGDIVECGVSIGQGALLFLLLCEYIGIERTYLGFDSFEGFPSPSAGDDVTPNVRKGFYANSPEVVLRTLRDGGVSEQRIQDRVKLVRGWFHDTLHTYDGAISVLHLDCDLYESYLTALKAFYGKVIPGGVIMFDEYNDQDWPGATKAIDEFFADKPETVKAHMRCDWKYFVVKL